MKGIHVLIFGLCATGAHASPPRFVAQRVAVPSGWETARFDSVTPAGHLISKTAVPGTTVSIAPDGTVTDFASLIHPEAIQSLSYVGTTPGGRAIFEQWANFPSSEYHSGGNETRWYLIDDGNLVATKTVVRNSYSSSNSVYRPHFGPGKEIAYTVWHYDGRYGDNYPSSHLISDAAANTDLYVPSSGWAEKFVSSCTDGQKVYGRYTYGTNNDCAFVYQNGWNSTKRIGGDGGDPMSYVYVCNSRGTLVGNDLNSKVAIRKNGTLSYPASIISGGSLYFSAINESDLAIGSCTLGSNSLATVWYENTAYDLNQLLEGYTGPALSSALYFHPDGTIIARNAAGELVRVTAVPEPATWLVLGAGALLWRRRRRCCD